MKKINEGLNKCVLYHAPQHMGHLIAVQLGDGDRHFDLFHSVHRLCRVIVDEAPAQQQLALLRVGVFQIEEEVCFPAVMQQYRGEFLVAPGHLLPHLRDVDKVAGCAVKAAVRRQCKRQQAPVDAVGAIALGGEFVADIGAAAQHPLAGGRLLPGGAVAGLVGKDNGADVQPGEAVCIQIQCVQRIRQHRRYLTCGPGTFQRRRGLGPGHIVRVAAGQGELRQLHGVGTVGGCLAGGDELVCGGDLIPQNGGHL